MKQIMMIVVMLMNSFAFCAETEDNKKSMWSKLNEVFGDNELFTEQGEFDWNELFPTTRKGKHEAPKPYEFNLWGNIKFFKFSNTKKDKPYIDNELILENCLYVYNDKLQAVFFTMYDNENSSMFKFDKGKKNKFGFDENSFAKIKNNLIGKMTKIFGEPFVYETLPLSITSWEYKNFTFEVETGVDDSFITFNIINKDNQVKIPDNWKEIVKDNYKNRSIKEFYYIPQVGGTCAAYSRIRKMQYWGCAVNIVEEVYLTYEEAKIGWNNDNYSYFSFFKSLYKSPNLIRLNKSYERGFSKFELNFMGKVSKYKVKRMNDTIEERIAKYIRLGIPCEICFGPGFTKLVDNKKIPHADNAFSFTKSGKFFSWSNVKVDEEELNGDARFYAPSDCEVITDCTLVTPF